MSSQSPNQLLASLPRPAFDRLRPHLRSMDLVQEDVLFYAGDTVHRIYFPHHGVISLVVKLADGALIETAMVGRDGIFGASSALDGQIALSNAIVQLAGEASFLDVLRVRQIAEESAPFRQALMRHEQMLLVQAQQSAACNASHPVEGRLARWLLRARDLSADDVLPFTQEFLSQMLGVRRSSVSAVANTLQNAGLIKYSRGRIEITNIDGLRDASCECYSTVRAQHERLAGLS